MTGHRKWSTVREQAMSRPGVAELVGRESEETLAELAAIEEPEDWTVELQALTEGDEPSAQVLTEHLVEALAREQLPALSPTVTVKTGPDGRVVLAVVLALGLVAVAVGLRRSTARRVADIVALELEQWGSVVAESIKAAA